MKGIPSVSGPCDGNLGTSPSSLCPSRRVHISSVTLEHLNGSYKVEPGDGQSRDSYLKEHRVVTFLVVNPKVRQDFTTQQVPHWELGWFPGGGGGGGDPNCSCGKTFNSLLETAAPPQQKPLTIEYVLDLSCFR